MLTEGSMVLTDLAHYSDEWPQVAKVVKVGTEGKVELQWFKGCKSGIWQPCTIPALGQRGKRTAWVEEISSSAIWMSNFQLTAKNCLPKYVREAIDNYVN